MSTNRGSGFVWTIRSLVLACAAGLLFAGSVAAQLAGKGVERLPVVPTTTLTITAKAGEGGKISPAGTVSVKKGATQQFELVANTGWAAREASGCGGTGLKIAGEHTTYTTARVSDDCNVLALFVRLHPRLTSFKINNDAAQTLTQSVTLNYSAATGPTYPAASHYRVSMRSDFLGAQWKPVSGTATITHQLEPGPGTKTLYFQLRKGNTGVSDVLSDSIELAQRQLHTIAAHEFYDAAGQVGFATRADHSASTCGCTLIPGPADGIAAEHVTARASPPCARVGPVACRFDFFAGSSLRNDFVFKAISDNAGAVPGCDIFRSGGPAAGGTSFSYRIELLQSTTQCQYVLRAMHLEGPPNRSWREALGLKP